MSDRAQAASDRVASAGALTSLWDWSLAAWAAPGVAETCLDLQDGHGQSVPLLLWAAWIAGTGRRPDDEAIEAACDTARAWSDAAVTPLRAIRRTLKAPIPDLDDAAREAVRDGVKALELQAERHLLAALEGLAPAPSGPPRRAIEGLVDIARVWARIVPRPALVRLAERLPG